MAIRVYLFQRDVGGVKKGFIRVEARVLFLTIKQ